MSWTMRTASMSLVLGTGVSVCSRLLDQRISHTCCTRSLGSLGSSPEQ